MALQVKLGSITLTGAEGAAEAYTGLGFQPTALLFFSDFVADAADGDHLYDMVGFATPGGSAAHFLESAHNVATSSLSCGFHNVSCIYKPPDNAGGTEIRATRVSLDADGFTLNWNLTVAGRVIRYVALGGDVASAQAGTFNSNAGTGNQAVTGVGFQPKLVLFITSRTSTTANGVTTSGNHGMCLGAAKSSTERWAVSARYADNAAAGDVVQITADNRCFINGLPGLFVDADFVSMDADGFTVNITTAGGQVGVSYLALGGADLQVALGTESQKTSTGTKAKTGVGFQPEALPILRGSGATALNTTTDHVAIFTGSAPSVAAQAVCGIGETDAADPTVAKRRAEAAAAALYISGSTPTVNARAELDSLDADGFTLDWTTADATARLFAFVAMRGASAAGGAIAAKQDYYRRRRAA